MHSFGYPAIGISKILIIWLMCLCTSGFVIRRHQAIESQKKMCVRVCACEREREKENRKKVVLIYVFVTCSARLSRGAFLLHWAHHNSIVNLPFNDRCVRNKEHHNFGTECRVKNNKSSYTNKTPSESAKAKEWEWENEIFIISAHVVRLASQLYAI